MWECGWCGRNRRPDGRSGVAGDAIPGRRVRARVGGRTWRSSRRLKPRSKSWARILFHLNGALVGRDGQTDRPGLARWLAVAPRRRAFFAYSAVCRIGIEHMWNFQLRKEPFLYLCAVVTRVCYITFISP